MRVAHFTLNFIGILCLNSISVVLGVFEDRSTEQVQCVGVPSDALCSSSGTTWETRALSAAALADVMQETEQPRARRQERPHGRKHRDDDDATATRRGGAHRGWAFRPSRLTNVIWTPFESEAHSLRAVAPES